MIERFNGNGDLVVVGTRVEYRIFGILLCKKELHLPSKYGVCRYDNFQTRI